MKGFDAATLATLAEFPGRRLLGEDVIWCDDPAVRWSLYEKHSGRGAFDSATRAKAYIMGINHTEFGPRGSRREHALVDESAVWKQILLAKG